MTPTRDPPIRCAHPPEGNRHGAAHSSERVMSAHALRDAACAPALDAGETPAARRRYPWAHPSEDPDEGTEGLPRIS